MQNHLLPQTCSRPTRLTLTSTKRVLTLRRGSRFLAFLSFVASTTQDLRRLSSSSYCSPASRRRPLPSFPSTHLRKEEYNTRRKDSGDGDDFIPKALGSIGGEITFNGALGFGAGYTLKKIGKMAAIFLGVAFIASQSLGRMGYVEVNWKKIEGEVLKFLDLDGDDKLTVKDVALYWDKMKRVLMHNLPSTATFTAMFVLGLQKG